jgi:hypothetical protein
MSGLPVPEAASISSLRMALRHDDHLNFLDFYPPTDFRGQAGTMPKLAGGGLCSGFLISLPTPSTLSVPRQ